jgi:hypothetical protein
MYINLISPFHGCFQTGDSPQYIENTSSAIITSFITRVFPICSQLKCIGSMNIYQIEITRSVVQDRLLLSLARLCGRTAHWTKKIIFIAL